MEPIMPEKKHAEGSGLKNKLEELSNLPGETPLDKDQAWEKLYLVLHKRQNRNISIWYWAAAGCLVVSFLMFRILETNKTRNLIKYNSPITLTKIQANPSQPAKKPNPILADEVVSKNKQVIQEKAEIKQGKSVLSIRTIKNDRLIINRTNSLLPAKPGPAQMVTVNQLTAPPPLRSNLAISPYDQATTRTDPLISKRKLRVVHVNELDEPAEQDNKWVRNSSRLSLQIQLIGRAIPQNNSMESNHSEYGTLKINLPSPN
jgi:hypothetical protein